MKITPFQAAAIKEANAILAKAGLPLYDARQYPTIELVGEDQPVHVNLARVVKVSPSPFQTQWQVHGGTGKWHGRVGRHVGAIEITNSRAHGILLEFPCGAVQAFHEMDMFRWQGEPVAFRKQLALTV